MQLGCIGLVIGLALTWGGGQQVYESWSGGEKRDVTLAEFMAEKPGVGWFRIKDASWSVIDGAVITNMASGNASGDVYVPIVSTTATIDSPTNPASQKIAALVHYSDNATASTLMAFINEKDPVKADLLLASSPHLTQKRPVEGMVEFGINSDDKDHQAVKDGFGSELADDFIVITDGAEPAGYLWPFAALVAGLALLWLSIKGFAKTPDPDPVDE